jgi:hypothetical protein
LCQKVVNLLNPALGCWHLAIADKRRVPRPLPAKC